MNEKINDKKSFLRLKVLIIFSILTFVSFSPIFSGEKILDNYTLINGEISNDNEMIIYYQLSELIQTQISTDKGIFTILEIPNSGYIGEIGRPQLPMQTRLYAVPDTQVSLKILNITVLESRDVGMIYPTQKLPSDGERTEEFEFDETYYQQDILIPGNIVEISDSGNIRDIPFVRIVFHPVQYNPKKEIAVIYDSIKIQLNWNDSEDIMVESNFPQTPFYSLYQNVFTNWENFSENKIIERNSFPIGEKRDTGCEYLIITHPNFYNQSKNLSDWKYKTGWLTKLVNITDIGSSAEELRDYIQYAYNNWNPAPYYMLLIGDDEYVPTNYINIHPYDGSYIASDLWYVTVNGTDYYPDIFYGRISVDTVEQAEIVIQKILKYEQNPPSKSSFYNNMVVAAYFQDDEQNGYETRRFVRTSEEIRDYLLDQNYEVERIYVTESYINPTHYNNGYFGNGEPLPEELLRPTFAWDGDADDIINAIEDGIFILNHRDHGSEDGWGDPYFDSSHIEGLTNGELLPVVFSINCLTGEFDGYECFSETFLRKEDGGAVAVFGATRVSYSGYNDFLARGFYDAQWPDFDQEIGEDLNLYSLGEIMNYGKFYMANTWGNDWGYEELTFELFHIFGDPTMHIWTAFPRNLTVQHPTMIDYGQNIVEVYVESNGEPVEGALICLSQENGLYLKTITDSTGYVKLVIEIDSTEDITLVVTSHNCLSYSNNIKIKKPEPPIVDGPEFGKIGKEYQYSAITTDPDENQIFYNFDWGDGTSTGWLGPFDSGQVTIASHTWSKSGNYSLKVKAKNMRGAESYWSEPCTVQIVSPIFNIERITSGMFKITLTIKNTGIIELDDINWKISLDGGFILLGKETTGDIDTIAVGEQKIITSKTIIGFGSTRVFVRVDIPEKTRWLKLDGFMYLFYIRVNPSGS